MHPRTLELLNYFDSQRAVLRAAYAGVPPSLRTQAPVPDRWSAAGVVEHLAIVETRVAGRLVAQIASARADGIGPKRDATPIVPTIGLNRVLDRTNRVSAPSTAEPTGLPKVPPTRSARPTAFLFSA